MELQRVTLASLPAETLESILWHSRELSLINACRSFQACLPSFALLARSFAVLAFSQISQAPTTPDGIHYQGPVTEFFLRKFHSAFPVEANLSFPLSLEERARLQHDVLCSGWWNINRFHAVHLYLFRHHLLSFDARGRIAPFHLSTSQSRALTRYVEGLEQHWASWTMPEGTPGSRELPLVMPWQSMPSLSVNMAAHISEELRPPIFYHLHFAVENITVTIDQHAFTFRREWTGREHWNILRVNDSHQYDLHETTGGEPSAETESLENSSMEHYRERCPLPPRPLLSPPFTAQKRGILVYLMREAAGRHFITDSPALNDNATREEDSRLIHRAILEAIPLGDVLFLKILLTLLEWHNPTQLSSYDAYSAPLGAPHTLTGDRSTVGLFTEAASWSRADMDEYVLMAMNMGRQDILSAILYMYAKYDKRPGDITQFKQHMNSLAEMSRQQCRATNASGPRQDGQVRDAIAKTIKSMRAATSTSDYMRDKWLEDEA